MVMGYLVSLCTLIPRSLHDELLTSSATLPQIPDVRIGMARILEVWDMLHVVDEDNNIAGGMEPGGLHGS